MPRLRKGLEALLIRERVIGPTLFGRPCVGFLTRLNHADDFEDRRTACRIESDGITQITLVRVSLVALNADDRARIYGRIIYPVQGATCLLYTSDAADE